MAQRPVFPMHTLLAILRHIHRELYLLGPGIVPAVLGKYKAQCGVMIALLCAAAAAYDLKRRSWLGGVLWVAAAGLVYGAFEGDAMLWGPQTAVRLAVGAIVAAALAVLAGLAEELRLALARGRMERREMRRVPGAGPR